MNSLPVENPTVTRFMRETGLTITTDQQGKDDARAQLEQHGGVMIESRYFVGGVLVTRAIGRNPRNGMPTFEWSACGETFTGHIEAFRKALSTLGIVSR